MIVLHLRYAEYSILQTKMALIMVILSDVFSLFGKYIDTKFRVLFMKYVIFVICLRN